MDQQSQPNQSQSNGEGTAAGSQGSESNVQTQESQGAIEQLRESPSRTSEQSGGKNQSGWLQRWLSGGGPSTTTEVGPNGVSQGHVGDTSSNGDEGSDGKAVTVVEKPRNLLEGDPNEPLTLTRAEAAKLVQSEKDRQIARENARNADLARQRATAEQLQHLQELADPDTGDPDKLAEAVRDLLASKQSQESVQQRQEEILGHVREVGGLYDTGVVEPVLAQLPKEVRARIEAAAPEHLIGLEHRTHLVQEALKALKATWSAGAEERAKETLRKNPAFRKELLAEMRGGLPEPELLPAAASANGHSSTSDWLRKAMS